MNIWYGSGENAWLSNLHHRVFSYEHDRADWTYMSVEHAYQTLKSGEFNEDLYWNDRWKTSGAKVVGRKGTNTKGNWNLHLMRRLVFKSFIDNPMDAHRLCTTVPHKFTHHQDRGIWREKFPEILMDVRADLRLIHKSWFAI